MIKKLTVEQFRAAVNGLDIGQQTIEIAYGVLVEGKSQISFVSSLGLSKGAISQAVNRVWKAHLEKNLPEGFERITAILPKHKAYIVKKWEKMASKGKPDTEDL